LDKCPTQTWSWIKCGFQFFHTVIPSGADHLEGDDLRPSHFIDSVDIVPVMSVPFVIEEDRMRATAISGIFLLLAWAALAQTPKRTASGVPSGKAVLKTYVSAWNRHDFAACDKILAPDAVHEDIALGVYAQGIAQIKDFMRKVIQGQPDLEWRVSRFVESGPVVVAEWTWTSTFTGDSPTGPVKNLRVSGRGVSVVTTENGQIKHLTDYYDLPSFFPKAPTDTPKANK